MTPIEAAEREADVLIHQHQSCEFQRDAVEGDYRRACDRAATAAVNMHKAIAHLRALQAAAKEGEPTVSIANVPPGQTVTLTFEQYQQLVRNAGGEEA